MTVDPLQAQLFQALKTKLPSGASLATELAQLLQISTDSAYRRMKGEKLLTLEELNRLCQHYQLSMDSLLHLQNGTVSFEGRSVDPPVAPLEDHLQALATQLENMAACDQRELCYLCKDIPLFYHYHSKPLAAFSYFFLHKTILAAPGFSIRRFRLADYPDDLFLPGQQALAAYRRLSITEIWNLECLNNTLRQLQFCLDTAAFYRKDDLQQVYEGIENLLLHVEEQAARGHMFDPRDKAKEPLGDFRLYYNEIMTGDNSILAVLDGVKAAFLSHTGINLMLTRDAAFCENLYRYQQNLMRKSTLISTVSERERAAFFYELRRRIEAQKTLLLSSE